MLDREGRWVAWEGCQIVKVAGWLGRGVCDSMALAPMTMCTRSSQEGG